MIRQFKLRNEYSREYNLNIPNTAFLFEPDGLGYEMDYSFMLSPCYPCGDTSADGQKIIAENTR